MPLVQLNRNPELVSDQLFKEVAEALPGIVASALGVPGSPQATLTPRNIEVVVRDTDPRDVNTTPLSITIFTNDYPERRANLDERRNQIIHAIKPLIPANVRGFVWVLLVPASFGEF